MLPWEHHIGCQVSQIAFSKSTENVFLTVVTAVTGWTVVRKITQSLNKKNHATSQQIFFCCFCFTFSVIFEKAIWQIWQPMWCSQGSALRFSQGFCGKVTWKFLVDRLRDFFKKEVVWFSLWRGCVIFVCGEVVWFFSLTHSGCMIHLSGGCVIFFAEGWMIFCWQVAGCFVWRGCLIFLCEEVAGFFVWRGFFFEKKSFLVKTVFWWKQFFGEKSFFGHYCHYYYIGRQVVR